MSLDYDKDFILYTFTSNTSFVVVLMQKSNAHEEFLTALISSRLQNAELKCHDVDKQDFAMFKAVKNFRPYSFEVKEQSNCSISWSNKFCSPKRIRRNQSPLDDLFARVRLGD